MGDVYPPPGPRAYDDGDYPGYGGYGEPAGYDRTRVIPAASGSGAYGEGWEQQAADPYWAPPEPPQRRWPVTLAVAVLAVLMLVALGVGRSLWHSSEDLLSGTGQRGDQPFASSGDGRAEAADTGSLTAAANRVTPGIVDINTTLGFQNGRAAGTGIVLTSDGEVLTNNHVINGATSITATDVGNGRTYQAEVVGYSRTDDIAVLRLRGASGLTTVTAGDSSKVSVGDAVVAVGNAGGVGGAPSVAPGRVTALDQSITAADEASGATEQLTGLIQVAANVQPGDSGGPLVDNTGKVIGINTAASSGFEFQSSGGQGFAVPIASALDTARQIEQGRASASVHIGETGFLGVQMRSATEGAGGRAGQDGGDFGDEDRGQPTSGALVTGVVSGSPADGAGLTSGDLIFSLDGETVGSATDLTDLTLRHHPGDRVRLEWMDQFGVQQSETVRLATGPPQ